MDLFEALDASEAHSAIGHGQVWKAEGDKYRVLYIDSNDRFLLRAEDAKQDNEMYKERGWNFRPLKG